jgi:hypothetical protein
MRADELREVCIESCDSVIGFLSAMQMSGKDIGRAASEVASFKIKGDCVVLRLTSRVMDPDSLGISIDGKAFYDPQVRFDRYDETSLTIAMYCDREVMIALTNDKAEVSVVSDMKWLIKRTESYFDSFGDRLALPPAAPSFEESEHPFPRSQTPSEDQKEAVHTVLNSKLSYIWGAPGTGKTQFVLATALLSYIRKGKRVAVFAPTNLSLEQVLRGLLKIIKAEDPKGKIVDIDKDVLRVGTPTEEFVKEYPGICEAKGIDRKIAAMRETVETLKAVIFERRCEMLKADFDQIGILNDEYGKADHRAQKKIDSQIRGYLNDIRAVTATDARFRELTTGVDEYNIRAQAPLMAQRLYERPRPTQDYDAYEDQTIEDIQEKIDHVEADASSLKASDPIVRAETAKIVAMTPHVYMGRFTPPHSTGGPTDLNVDHIFVDEVGYCSVILTLPLFTCGVPISMLGDHMQLPPVCEIEEDVLEGGIRKNNQMRYAFMWDQSALYAEGYFTGCAADMAYAYLNDAEPVFRETRKVDLTASHRFGNNLADVLDKFVYKNGIRGMAEQPLEIVCVDAVCRQKKDRENEAEAEAVGRWVEENRPKKESFVILTPYSKQIGLLKRKYPELKDNILTVHKSQGREWDTVVLSVCDCRIMLEGKDVQRRFTSTRDPGAIGAKVINTAVSRTRKKLVIVCDKEFWTSLDGELIGKLVEAAE